MTLTKRTNLGPCEILSTHAPAHLTIKRPLIRNPK
jgi:hypothetical protein